MNIRRLGVACESLGWGGWTLKNEELVLRRINCVVCCEKLIVRCEWTCESLGKGSWNTNN
jgi:hypothetical protein